jgi:hypothetical protein
MSDPLKVKHKITKQDYYYECGDGCCSWNATRWYLNEVEVYDGTCEDSAFLELLKALGIQASMAGLDEKDEELWELSNYPEIETTAE